ncbi:MAG TPA: GGDEF domain-containing protein [Terracidiphilus sp.]|jgi:diguanylate cyclase (GGDEF)-like protein
MGRTQIARILSYGLWAVVCLHALVLLAGHPAPILLSRSLTAAVPTVAGAVCIWRAIRLPARERPVWLWSGAGMLLWAIAHLVETVLGHSSAASNLTVDASDFIYLAGTFPLLVALSTTRETESIRAVFALNLGQIGLALLLSYSLLYRMALSPQAASTVMGRIYGATCILLALMSVLRLFTWASPEERRSTRCLCLVLWTYMPIEIGMDYATARWNLHSGSILDLLWSVPFFVGGWQALRLPIGDENQERSGPTRARLVVEALCPMLITAGIFLLAAAVTPQHMLLGLGAIFVLLTIQGVQAAILQLNYLAGRNLLLEREHDLREINATLRQMSLEDPLTHIANRRRFETTLHIAWRRGARKAQPLALLMVDVDFFKGVNDQHGHTYGDECLVAIARILQEHARRPDDVVARLGGEEFVMLLPDTRVAGAETVAARLLDAIRGLGVENKASPFDQKVTISIGVGTVTEPAYGVDPTVLVDCADQALYDAKHTGRNRTCTRTLD